VELDRIVAWRRAVECPHPVASYKEDDVVGGVGRSELVVREACCLVGVVDVVGVVGQWALHGADVDDVSRSVVDWYIVETVQVMWEGGIHSQVSHSQQPQVGDPVYLYGDGKGGTRKAYLLDLVELLPEVVIP
jgi:hypothetical protein